MDKSSKIFIAGHRGLVGSALVRRLIADGYSNLVTRTRAELDLTRQADVERFFSDERPSCTLLAAAKVGGILANSRYPADFVRENLQVQVNVIDAAHRYGVEKFVFLGSSCIYPKHAPQPMKEEHLLTGPLEATNEAYAIAKIAGLKMCQFYWQQYGFNAISLMPTNLYGPGDNFDLETSHVLPALLRKFHEATVARLPAVTIWGTGCPRREFLHVDDMADACAFLLEQTEESIAEVSPDRIFNVGVGEDIEIRELAQLIKRVVGNASEIAFDASKPDGTPRKLLDVSRMLALGWRSHISLEEGISSTYRWFREAQAKQLQLVDA
jgi:GDP-L-fucose synthase